MKINLTKTFKNCVAAVPSCAMIVGGGLMAVDGMRYGRVDVAAGGAALCGIGMELFGLYKNNNRILGIFNHNSEGFWSAPGNRMATLGLTACAFLGGGELPYLMERYDKNLADIMSIDAWKEMANDPAIYKVAANFTVFPLASVLDFKKVEDFAVKHKLKTPHRMLQTGLLLSGAYMILRFGELGKIFSARAFGRMNVAAGFVRLGQLSETGAGAPKPDVVARDLN